MKSLTDSQLLYLDLLSCDCGIPGWQATKVMGSDKGNLSRTIVKPLKTSGFFVPEEVLIYCPGIRNTTRRGSKKPKTFEEPYYINKNYDALSKIQRDLADPVVGRIWHHEKIDYNEEFELNRRKGNNVLRTHKDETSLSDMHIVATRFLQAFIHLYLWCDKFIDKINALSYEPDVQIPFSLVTAIPTCACCQELDRQIKFDRHYRDLTRAFMKRNIYLAKIKMLKHGIFNIDELRLPYIMKRWGESFRFLTEVYAPDSSLSAPFYRYGCRCRLPHA